MEIEECKNKCSACRCDDITKDSNITMWEGIRCDACGEPYEKMKCFFLKYR